MTEILFDKTPHLDVGALLVCTASRHIDIIDCSTNTGPQAAHFVLHVVVHVAVDDFDVLLLHHIHHQRGDLGDGRRWPHGRTSPAQIS